MEEKLHPQGQYRPLNPREGRNPIALFYEGKREWPSSFGESANVMRGRAAFGQQSHGEERSKDDGLFVKIARLRFCNKAGSMLSGFSTAPTCTHFGGPALSGWKIVIYGKTTILVNIHEKEVNLSAGCFSTKRFLRKKPVGKLPHGRGNYPVQRCGKRKPTGAREPGSGV